MAIQRAIVDKESKATVVCKKCGRDSTISASQYLGNQRVIQFNAKCPCGNTFKVLLERRQIHRKETDLAGEVYFQDEPRRKYVIKVLDISQGGVKFTLPKTTTLSVNDRVVLEFQLDDKERSLVKKTAIIMNIRGDLAGAQFTQTSEYDRIAKYLKFN